MTADEAEEFATHLTWMIGAGPELPHPLRMKVVGLEIGGVVVRGGAYLTAAQVRRFAGELLAAAELARAYKPFETPGMRRGRERWVRKKGREQHTMEASL